MTKSTKFPAYSLDYINKSVIPAIIKHKYSWPFIKAVDYVALNIPDYPKIIRNPMDFTKVKEKIRKKEYNSVSDCIADINTIFSNCYLFNQPGEEVVFMALKLDSLLKEKLKFMSPDITSSLTKSHTQTSVSSKSTSSSILGKRKLEDKEKVSSKMSRTENEKVVVEETSMDSGDLAKCSFIIRELMSSKYQKWNALFLHPVDVEGQKIFNYYDIIKRPMDLSTIKSKLEAKLYDHKDKFFDDIELVINNCIKYNGETSSLGLTAKKFHEIYKDVYVTTYKINKPMEVQLPPVEKPVVNPQSVYSPEISKPISTKPIADSLDKKTIVDLLTKIEKQQDDLMQKSKKFQELMSVQNTEIEELYQKLISLNAIEKIDGNPEFGDAGSLMSNMSESILSSSTSTISNSRKSKRQIRPPKSHEVNDIVSTPQSVTSRRSVSSNLKSNQKKSSADVMKRESVPTKREPVVTKREAGTVKPEAVVTGSSSKPAKSSKVRPATIPAPSITADDQRPMSYEEKWLLSNQINKMHSDKLTVVLQIIQRNEVALQESDPEELEIDFEVLQTRTLRELEKFVASTAEVEPSARRPAKGGKGPGTEYTVAYNNNNVSQTSRNSSQGSSSSSSDCSESSESTHSIS